MSITDKLRRWKHRIVLFIMPFILIMPRIGHAAARVVPHLATKAKVFLIIIGVTGAGGTSWIYFETDNPTRDMIAVFENMQLFKVDKFDDKISKPHYPGNESYAKKCSEVNCFTGVTLGFGFDAGFRKPEDMTKDLMKAGIDDDRLTYFIHAAGLKGIDAYNWIKEQEKLGLIKKISKDEGLKLLEIEIEKAMKRVKRRLEIEGLVGKLNEMQFAVLVSLDYNCPCLVSNKSVKNLWKLIHKAVSSQSAEDWKQVAEEIQYRSGSNKNSQLQTRRNIEAQNFLNYSVEQQDDLPPVG